MASFDFDSATKAIADAAKVADGVQRAIYGDAADTIEWMYVPITAPFEGEIADKVAACGGFPVAWNGFPVRCDKYIGAFMVRGTSSAPKSGTKYLPMPLMSGMGISEIKEKDSPLSIVVSASGTWFSGLENAAGFLKSIQLRIQTWATKVMKAGDNVIADIGDPIDLSCHFIDYASISNIASLPVQGMMGWTLLVCGMSAPWITGKSDTTFGMKAAVADKNLERLNINVVNGKSVTEHAVFDMIGCVVFLLPPNNFATQKHVEMLSKRGIDIAATSTDELEVDKIVLKGTSSDKKATGPTLPKFRATRKPKVDEVSVEEEL